MASKRRIAIVTLSTIALAAIVFTPKVIGLGIRDLTLNNLIALVPPESDGQLAIDETMFNSGWFRSTATLNADYAPFGTESVNVQFDFNIQHGPLLFTVDGPRLGVAYAQITPKSADGLPLFQSSENLPLPRTVIELFASFDQSLLVSLTVDPISYVESGSTLEFDGLSASLSAMADQSANVSVSMGKLNLTEANSNQNFSVAGMSMTSYSSRLNDVLAPTTASFSIPSIRSSAPIAFELNNLTANSELKASTNPEAIMMVQRVAAESIAGDIPLQSFEWSIEVDEIQRRLVADYYALIAGLQAQSASNPQAAAQNINLISQQLTQLFVNNPLSLRNRLVANVYEGEHSAEVEFKWAGLPSLTNIARLDLNEGLAALNFTLDVALDRAAIMTSPIADQVNVYIQQGYIVPNNDQLTVKASLINSQLLLNGEEIPLENFF